MTQKMTREQSQKFVGAVARTHNPKMVTREEAARIDVSAPLCVTHTCGFTEDCREAFDKIGELQLSIDKMIEWGCVFGPETVAEFHATRRRLSDLENMIHQTYKHADDSLGMN